LFVVFFVYISTMKIEAVPSPETSVNFYPITRHHIPEDGTLTSTLFLLDRVPPPHTVDCSAPRAVNGFPSTSKAQKSNETSKRKLPFFSVGPFIFSFAGGCLSVRQSARNAHAVFSNEQSETLGGY
jgi:hypothetical protein